MTVELYPLPEFQIFRKNILHLWKERKYVVRIEAKVLTLLTTHDVIATVGKKVVLHPPPAPPPYYFRPPHATVCMQ